MGNIYSISRLGTFSTCRLQYKYAYIDRVEAEMETIEAFMGSRVHDALKVFYDQVKNKIVKSKDWLIQAYHELWQKNFHEAIKIVRSDLKAEDYYHKGWKCLSDYYEEYYPFDQAKVVKTEEKILFTIKHQDGEYFLQGVLDRLDWNDREKIFEIHDYKTSATLMTQEEADEDLQLPLYQLAIQSLWPEAEKVKLVWHYLLFNKEIESRRTKEQLESLKELIISQIKEIESCTEFPPCKSSLCDWCAYQEICPLWKHPKEMEKLEVNEYRKNPGVVLVSQYAALEEEKQQLRARIAEIEEEQSKIEEAAIEFAEREGIQVIDGPAYQLVVTVREEVVAPTRKENEENWQRLRDILIQENRFTEVSTINNAMLNNRIKSWPKEFYEKIKEYLTTKVAKKASLRKKSY